VRKFIGRYGLPLVIASLLWLTWQFLDLANAKGWSTLWNTAAMAAWRVAWLDLVIAMPVSWLPLVADFSRHGRDGRGALLGHLARLCGGQHLVFCAGRAGGHHRAEHRSGCGAAAGARGLLAVGLILIDEVDNAYAMCTRVRSRPQPVAALERAAMGMTARCCVACSPWCWPDAQPGAVPADGSVRCSLPLYGVSWRVCVRQDVLRWWARASSTERRGPLAPGVALYQLLSQFAPHGFGAADLGRHLRAGLVDAPALKARQVLSGR